MNTIPDQTKTDTVAPSQTPSVIISPLVNSPPQNVATPPPATPSNNSLPLTAETIPPVVDYYSTIAPPIKPPASPPPFILHSDISQNKSHKFPLIVAGLFLLVTVLGFGGSVAYFGFINKPPKKIAVNSAPVNPTPVDMPLPTIQPLSNIFVTPSVSFQNLFSSDVFASDNPFDETTNPFTGVTTDSAQDSDAYQNPFEGQQ